MPRKRSNQPIALLGAAGVIALGLVAAPVGIDLRTGGLQVKPALADPGSDNGNHNGGGNSNGNGGGNGGGNGNQGGGRGNGNGGDNGNSGNGRGRDADDGPLLILPGQGRVELRGLQQVGPDLSREQELEAIKRGWR